MDLLKTAYEQGFSDCNSNLNCNPKKFIKEHKVTDKELNSFWKSLTNKQRLKMKCCSGCGSLDTSCKCNNDE